jgi:hypothetical protein
MYYGIDSDTAVGNAYGWGQLQADTCESAWLAKAEVNYSTIFADIEEGFGGWLSAGNTFKQVVFDVYIDQFKSHYVSVQQLGKRTIIGRK